MWGCDPVSMQCRSGIATIGLGVLSLLLVVFNRASPITSSGHTLQWRTTRSSCTQAKCQGANLTDIPDFPGQVPVPWLTQQQHLFDGSLLARCLSRQRVWLLGDSTMSETTHDLVLLLSGQGGKDVTGCHTVAKPRQLTRHRMFNKNHRYHC